MPSVTYRNYLKPFQCNSYDYCITHDNCGLLPVEMRGGKTYITIASILYKMRKIKLDCKNILIVCPYSAFFGWNETLQFFGINKNQIIFLTGTQQERLAILKTNENEKNLWYIINKEGFLILPEIKNLNLYTVILDESRIIANPKSQVSKFFTKNFTDVKSKYALSGFPWAESKLELFQQLKFLFDTVLGCENYYKFRKKYFRLYGYTWKITKNGDSLLSKFIANNCTQLYRRDISDFKYKKNYLIFSCEKPEKLKKIENDIKSLMILKSKSGIEIDTGKFSIEAFTWLRLLTGGIYNNELWFIDKLSLIEEVMNEHYSNKKIIIWAVYTEEIKMISKFFKIPYIDGSIFPVKRDEIIKKFKFHDVNKIVIQPECFKYGQNLHEADVCIYYSTPFSMDTRKQTEDRIIDIKNKSDKDIVDLVMRESIDEDIILKLKNKESNIEFFKRLIEKYKTYEKR